VLATVNMHHVPSPEMDDFEVGHWYVAESSGRMVGVAGYRLLGPPDAPVGKTTLLAVDPEQRQNGIRRCRSFACYVPNGEPAMKKNQTSNTSTPAMTLTATTLSGALSE
jgi:acetyltransferase (GNAT) family protein